MMMGAAQLRYFAEMAEKVPLFEEIQVPQFPAQSKNYLQREPIGVCGQIIPWNFPLMMAVWKVGPALCTGNTLVLKPASDTPCSALELARIIDRTDLPRGVVNVVHGSGAECGEELCTSPLVDKVALTGSTEVGRRVQQLASGTIKKVTLELGGKSANIVLDDVKNSMKIAQEEIFGPVLVVIRYKNIDDAIRMANDSIYGLGGAVWSRDKAKALEVAKQMRTGTVWINDYHLLSVAAPFGGYKQSGIGREFGLEGVLEYTEVKHVHVDQVDNRPAKFWYGALFGA